MGVVVSLLAVLELIKESLIELVQSKPFAPIYIRAAGSTATLQEDVPAAAAGER
jgi:segregation and condensation protein A